MKSLYPVAILILSVVMTGCDRTPRYVVYRDLPESPSITVMGLTWSERDSDYAMDLEPIVLSLGVRLVTPPARKRVELSRSENNNNEERAANDGIEKTTGRGGSNTVVETYTNVVEANSTHIMTADGQTMSVRVIEKASGQIVAVEKLNKISFTSGESEREAIAGMFKSLGFAIKE